MVFVKWLTKEVCTLARSKRFKGIAELKSAYNIDDNALLSLDSYHRPLQDYELPELEAQCQFLKSGKACNQAHMKGFVIQTKDEANVLVGRCCAFTRLGLQHDGISGDLRMVERATNLFERKEWLKKILQEKDKTIALTKAIIDKIDETSHVFTPFIDSLPDQVVHALKDRARSRNSDVVWGLQLVDKDGNRYWYPEKLGSLQGISCVVTSLEKDRQTLSRIKRKFSRTELSEEASEKEIKAVEEELKERSDIAVIENRVNDYIQSVSQFIRPSNLSLLPQVVSNQEARAMTLEAVSKFLGNKPEMSPNREIAQFDRLLKAKHKASGLKLL